MLWTNGKRELKSTVFSRLILVTGATGFIGAHIVDELLRRGYRVRATARSQPKGEVMRLARLEFADKLEFVTVGDLAAPGVFDDAVSGVDGIIHCASVSENCRSIPLVTRSVLTLVITACDFVGPGRRKGPHHSRY